jgi:serine/threonine protein kinase
LISVCLLFICLFYFESDELKQRLGSGGSGFGRAIETYRALDVKENKEVVLKIFRKGRKFNNPIIDENIEDLKGIVFYDNIFDYENRDNNYVCVVMKLQKESLENYVKSILEKEVLFFYLLYLNFVL